MLTSCPSCAGFIPSEHASCPNCERPHARLSRAAAQVAKAGAVAATMVTLMACYGMSYPIPEPPPVESDRDRDSFPVAPSGVAPSPAYDCDDSNPSIHPGAEDPVGDGLDQNCDGMDGMATTPAPTATIAVDPPPPSIAK